MKRYRFRCLRSSGKVVVGTIQAPSVGRAAAELSKRYPGPSKIVPEAHPERLFRAPAQYKLALFFRALDTLFQAGIPVVRGLDFLGLSEEDPDLKAAIDLLAQSLKSGSSLRQAFAAPELKRVFPTSTSALIAAGEKSGRLTRSINRLAFLAERENTLRAKIRSALAYPCFLLVGMSVLGILFVLLMGTQDTGLLSLFGKHPPLVTLWMMGIAAWLLSPCTWLKLALYGGALAGLLALCLRDAGVRRSLHETALRVPLVGDIWRKLITSQMTQIIATGCGVGLSLPLCLELARPLCTNLAMLERYDESVASFVDGESLDVALEESGVFSPLSVAMVRVGLENGKMEEMLFYLSGLLEEETQALLLDITHLLEPFLLLCAGVMTALLAVAALEPVFEAAQLL